MSGPRTPSPVQVCLGRCVNGRRFWQREFYVRSHEPDALSTFVS